ncbi:unnamed protein product (macronuclear) [Paramecium tetraurelia]|uniref:MORN repeat protein n=1 Tax=Paramecium tetraurelia TaxID=5888 RepID=A0BHL2_PARTE|nr:uncharacterized protein GSPATT00029064001 [Paramecium tetraurelia]CAK58029.1 unnamed protein product [Paramecium tetraurelia]|eukprot:XP_001425427.1 hypothetical protein (macronuclear) [Paramecium tetraurelia strain d4-2]
MGSCQSAPCVADDLLTMDSSACKQTDNPIKEEILPQYDENKIIIIQAHYRGHKVRKSLMPTISSPEPSAPTQPDNPKLCFDPTLLQENDQSIFMKNGAIYTGTWKDGKANGKGKYQFHDRQLLFVIFQLHRRNCNLFNIFQWIANELQGEGVYVNSNESYRGQWRDNMFHGQGEFRYYDGRIYTGQWKQGLQHGIGKEIYKDKSVYEGKFQNGMKCGLGIFQLSDGSVYQGEFENDLFHGYGSFTWPDKLKVFEGYWRNGLKNGNGTMKWGDGRIYSGQYLDDIKHGYGEMYYTDGRVYKGQWKQGVQDGIGQFLDKEGIAKKGFWVKGKLKKWI